MSFLSKKVPPKKDGLLSGKKSDADPGSDQSEAVVLLQKTIVRLVVVAVPAPAEPVHDPFVTGPGDHLHGGAGE